MKAIETVYSGYRFRSRLEARWAVFFDALGVVYQYEPEGYDLDGIWYLPDFWLPELGCWVEIKGEQPTEEESGKARLLACHTQKDVHVFAGNVWSSVKVVSYLKTDIFTVENLHPLSGIVDVALSLELAILLTKVDLIGICIALNPEEEGLCVTTRFDPARTPLSLETYLQSTRYEIRELETRVRELPDLIGQIEQHKKELFAQVAAVRPLVSSLYVVANRLETDWCKWVVCQICKKAHICNFLVEHPCCPCAVKVINDGYTLATEECRGDQELLLAAYTAARQARFDGKDAFPWQKKTTSGERDSKP